MRRGFVFVCLALLAGGGATAGDAPDFSRRVMNSADGGYCSQAGDLWRCRQFAAQELGEPSGGYADTRVWFDQWRNWPTGWANRTINCSVGRDALKVGPHRALVQAILDPASPACSSDGQWAELNPDTGEYVITPWLFAGPVVLEAELLAPRYEHHRVGTITYRDNQTGESQREQCQGGSGYRLYGGGFTVLGLYRAFGPGEADGSFFYEACGTAVK